MYCASCFLLSLLFINCSAEDLVSTENLSDNGKWSSGQVLNTRSSYTSCNENIEFPTRSPGPEYTPLSVIFNSKLSLTEIHCVKVEYFAFLFDQSLYMSSEQPDDGPYQELWLVKKGLPEGDIISDLENNPLTTSFVCDN